MQDGHLENLFFTSSPELKGQLTQNLVGSIRVTCRSPKCKIVPIRNYLENLFFTSSPELKGQLMNLGRKLWGDLDQK